MKNIIEFMEANKNKKVSEVKDRLIVMVGELRSVRGFRSANNGLFDKSGVIVGKKCWKLKRWLVVKSDDERFVEFGKKVSGIGGLDSMCKSGSKLWYNYYGKKEKNINDLLLGMLKLESGTKEYKEMYKKYESMKNGNVDYGVDYSKMCKSDYEKGFDEREQIIEYLKSRGVELGS